MAATASYSALLKRYTPESLIENEFAKMSYIYANCEKDKSWRGGTYEVPFLEAGFSSLQYGSLAASNDVAEMDVVMGTTTMKELWGSILVRESDLYRHGDMESSYLKIMPDKIEEFVKFAQEQVGIGFLAGARIARATANGTAGGDITVDKPYAFRKGMKIEVIDDDTGAATGYIRSININTGVLSVFDARTGGAAVNLSTFTTAQNARVRVVGSGTERFQSLRDVTLTAALGGSDSIYGLTKSSYAVLQSLQASGASFTAATILLALTTTSMRSVETCSRRCGFRWVFSRTSLESLSRTVAMRLSKRKLVTAGSLSTSLAPKAKRRSLLFVKCLTTSSMLAT
jgi:hypothetical protein